jgi:hypothetical protein
MLIWRSLKSATIKGLIGLLNDPELMVRTIAARELQLRGGVGVWKLCRSLIGSRKKSDRVVGLFILGQLGTPKLPYQAESFALIHSVLQRDASGPVVEQALYSIGHLRKGQPIPDYELARVVKNIKTLPGSALAQAKAFALRR